MNATALPSFRTGGIIYVVVPLLGRSGLPEPETNPEDQALRLGQIALQKGLINAEQLREALAEQAREVAGGAVHPRPLGNLLRDKGYITNEQLNSLLRAQTSSKKIFGKYQLLRELGRGGMGVVLEAVDTELKRRVALKMMLASPNADRDEASLDEERFLREAQLSAKLEKHPHIVGVYEAGVIDGRRYLAMEFIEGSPMSKWRKSGSVSVRQQVALLRDTALAVHHAHQHGIIHRDLKPENILVDPRNVPHVTDFGLAKSVGQDVSLSLTASGMVMGTPTHMSPEQAKGLKTIDHRADVYSMGVMLYETLTGRVPFQGETAIEILMKAVKNAAPPPSSIVKAGAVACMDSAIENICLKCLAKSPRDRYPSAEAFAEDLTRWLKGEEVNVAAPATRRKIVQIRKPKAWTYALAAGGVACLLALGIWLGGTGRKGAAEREIQDRNEGEILAALDRGDRLLRERKYAEALGAFESVIARDPEHPRAVDRRREAKRGLDEQIRTEREAAGEKARRELEAKVAEADRIRREAEEKARAERDATLESERQKLAEERRVLEEKAKEAEEARRKAEEQLKDAQARPTVVPLEPDEAWKSAVNLLPLIDLKQDAVSGAWTLKEGALQSDASQFARIEIPYRPPEEYDLRVVFTRKDGSGDVHPVLTKGGRSFLWLMGAYGNQLFGFHGVGGVEGKDHPASVRRPRCLEADRPYTCIVQVRNNLLRGYVDGQLLVECPVDYGSARMDKSWKLRDESLLGLACAGNVVTFHKIELLERTGKGSSSRTAAKTVDAGPARYFPPAAGLVGHWTLDEGGGTTAADLSGQKNSATLSNGPVWIEGKLRGGLRFDGVDDSVSASTTPYMTVKDDFTIALWAWPLKAVDDNGRPSMALHPAHGVHAFGSLAHAGVGIALNARTVEVLEHTGNYLPVVLRHPARLASWTHVAVVYEARRPSLYLNGRFVAFGAQSPKIVHPGSEFGKGYGDIRPYCGLLDDIRIYSRVLSPGEIKALANLPHAPVPDPAKQADFERTVREINKADYAKRASADQKALAEKLLKQGTESQTDLLARYVFLRESRDLAVQAGDGPLAFAAIDELASVFAVDALDLSATALQNMSKSAQTPAGAARVGRDFLTLSDRAAAMDDYDAAKTMVGRAEALARFSQDSSLLGRAQARRRELDILDREHLRTRASERTLETKPDDPGANLLFGKFLCFFKRDWMAGLPKLAKGADATLRALAAQDLSAPGDAGALVARGDAWWDQAPKHSGEARAAMQDRALEWYKAAWHQSSGDLRNKLRERFLASQNRALSGAARAGKPPAADVVLGIDETYAHTGTRSIRITHPPGSKAFCGWNSAHHPAKGGDQFVLSGWVLTDRITFQDVFCLMGGGNENLGIPDQPWWTFIQKTVTCPPGTTEVFIATVAWTDGSTIWLDDVSLKRVGDDRELIDNGSFER
jgi:hypothetical protein